MRCTHLARGFQTTLLAVVALLFVFAPTASASAGAHASVVGVGAQEVRSSIESFLVPVLPRPVLVRTGACPGDPSAQGCHTAGRREDTIWLNPQPESVWDYHESIRITRQLMGERMFPLTLEGLDHGMRRLTKAH